MSKFIALLTSAYVCGVLRHPDEGVLHLEDAEAQRLLDNQSGKDVSADFSADDHKEVPVQSLQAASSAPAAALALAGDAVQHQSEIPAVTETQTPATDEAAAKSPKEKAK